MKNTVGGMRLERKGLDKVMCLKISHYASFIWWTCRNFMTFIQGIMTPPEQTIPSTFLQRRKGHTLMTIWTVTIDFINTTTEDIKVLKGTVHGRIRESVGRGKILITKRVHKMYLRWSGLTWGPHKGNKISPEKNASILCYIKTWNKEFQS